MATRSGGGCEGPPLGFREGGEVVVTTTAVPREIVEVIADEMACGVNRAVDYWISQIDQALNDTQLTSLGRLYAIKDVVERYNRLTGKVGLEARRA